MGLIGDIVGAFTGGSEKKAGQTAALGQKEAAELYGRLLPSAEARFSPYQSAGQNALAQYLAGIQQSAPDLPTFSYSGDIPTTNLPQYSSYGQFQFDPSQLESNPAYQFRLNQGIEALNRGAGASGQLGSGNRLAALMNLGQGMASQEYADEWNRQFAGNQANYQRGVTDYGLNYGRAMDQYGIDRSREADLYSRALAQYGLDTDRSNTLYSRDQNYLNRLAGLSDMGFNIANLLTNVDMNATSGQANARIGAANALAAGQLGQANTLRNTVTDLFGAAAGAGGFGNLFGGLL